MGRQPTRPPDPGARRKSPGAARGTVQRRLRRPQCRRPAGVTPSHLPGVRGRSRRHDGGQTDQRHLGAHRQGIRQGLVMTPAALLEPALLRRLERLALQVRRAVSGQMGGERRSRRRGQSVEFADFRNYTPGDDFRLIDWNAYARLDRFMLRLFVAEEELPLSLFVDLSGSMDWGKPNKADTARQLAGAIAYVALAALDRVRLTVFAEGETSGGAPSRGRRAAATLFSRLQSFPAGGVTNYEKVVWPIGRPRPRMNAFITARLRAP